MHRVQREQTLKCLSALVTQDNTGRYVALIQDTFLFCHPANIVQALKRNDNTDHNQANFVDLLPDSWGTSIAPCVSAVQYQCLQWGVQYQCLQWGVQYQCLQWGVQYQCLQWGVQHQCLQWGVQYQCLQWGVNYYYSKAVDTVADFVWFLDAWWLYWQDDWVYL